MTFENLERLLEAEFFKNTERGISELEEESKGIISDVETRLNKFFEDNPREIKGEELRAYLGDYEEPEPDPHSSDTQNQARIENAKKEARKRGDELLEKALGDYRTLFLENLEVISKDPNGIDSERVISLFKQLHNENFKKKKLDEVAQAYSAEDIYKKVLNSTGRSTSYFKDGTMPSMVKEAVKASAEAYAKFKELQVNPNTNIISMTKNPFEDAYASFSSLKSSFDSDKKILSQKVSSALGERWDDFDFGALISELGEGGTKEEKRKNAYARFGSALTALIHEIEKQKSRGEFNKSDIMAIVERAQMNDYQTRTINSMSINLWDSSVSSEMKTGVSTVETAQAIFGVYHSSDGVTKYARQQ